MKNKKIVIVAVSLFSLLLIVGGVLAINRKRKLNSQKESLPEEDSRPLSLEEKPFLSLIPQGSIFKLLLTVSGANTEELEYEFDYDLKSGLTRGIAGSKIKLENGEGKKDLLLGSCSSGTCKYDEDVQKGKLIIGLKEGNKIRSFTAPFKILDSGDEGKTPDGLLEFSLARQPLGKYIFLTGGGLPKKIENKEILGGPYSFFSYVSGKVSFKEPETGQLYFFEEGRWQAVPGYQNLPLGTYLLVK